jgi:hypothetical protein
MLRVPNCAIRGPGICDLDGLSAFKNFAVLLIKSVKGLRVGLDYMDMKIINILSLLVIEPQFIKYLALNHGHCPRS